MYERRVKELDWFVQMLVGEFQAEVDRNQISFEGNELYLNEIYESLIPTKMTKGLPDKLLFETMMVEDNQGTEWIGAIAAHPESRKWLIKIILQNGEPVLRTIVGNKKEL